MGKTILQGVSSERNQNLRSEVEKYHGRGWSFTPLGGQDGKRPILKNWQHLPRAQLEEVLDWIAKGHNIGLRTGAASGVFVVDLDSPTIPSCLPPTVTVRTPRGYHLYYKYFGPWGNKKIPALLAMGIDHDIRGDGGQVVFPGSANRQTGTEYNWEIGVEL